MNKGDWQVETEVVLNYVITLLCAAVDGKLVKQVFPVMTFLLYV